MRIPAAIFLILHAGVHLLYAGHAIRMFELRPGLGWPDDPWLLKSFLSNQVVRFAATAGLVVIAFGFITAATGMMLRQTWSHSVAAYAAIVSASIYLFLWNGAFQRLDDQGLIGILINAALAVVFLAFRWPALPG